MDLQDERSNLRPLERDGRALGVVLVIGVAVTRGSHHLVEVAGEGGEAPECPLSLSVEQLASPVHLPMLTLLATLETIGSRRSGPLGGTSSSEFRQGGAMNIDEVLADALSRVREQLPAVVSGLDEEDLAWRPDPDANSIAWLVWHLTRVTDDHVAAVAGTDQVWTSGGWHERFGLPFPAADHGYGHTSADVAAVRVPADLLAGYHDAVAAAVLAFVGTLTPSDLDRVVDESWDPAVTLGVRLVSVVNEVNQHLGQAAYLRGLLERRTA